MVLGSGIRDPGSGKNLFRIPDPGAKKAPDHGSRIRIRNTESAAAACVTAVVLLSPLLLALLPCWRPFSSWYSHCAGVPAIDGVLAIACVPGDVGVNAVVSGLPALADVFTVASVRVFTYLQWNIRLSDYQTTAIILFFSAIWLLEKLIIGLVNFRKYRIPIKVSIYRISDSKTIGCLALLDVKRAHNRTSEFSVIKRKFF